MNIDEIIERIWYFRNKSKISARELSLMIEKNEGYINKLETKDFNLPTTMLLKIISALGISEEEFFSKNYKTFNKDNELFELIQSLPQEKKEYLIGLLK